MIYYIIFWRKTNTLEYNAKFSWIAKIKSKTLKKLSTYDDCFRLFPDFLGWHVPSVFSFPRFDLVEKFDKHSFEKYAVTLVELDKATDQSPTGEIPPLPSFVPGKLPNLYERQSLRL